MGFESSAGIRLQRLDQVEQALVLTRHVQSRSTTGSFRPVDLNRAFLECCIPSPAEIGNVLRRLERDKQVIRVDRGQWKLTPFGRANSLSMYDDLDLAALVAESKSGAAAMLGHTVHPVIPPSFAPPELIGPLTAFLCDFPFDNNIFAMTRYPDKGQDATPDPVRAGIEAAREVCSVKGLSLHLASDRMIVDDLWANVLCHMWACRYGVAIFEDRAKQGINYNLTIEVGGMLISGRRTALLKDNSIASMPTDLVGKIYKAINLDDPTTVTKAVKKWIDNDLTIANNGPATSS